MYTLTSVLLSSCKKSIRPLSLLVGTAVAGGFNLWHIDILKMTKSIQNYTACEELNSFHFQVMSIILDREPGKRKNG